MVENQNVFFRYCAPLFVGLAYLFLYLPIIVLVVFSFNDAAESVGWVGFSLRWYKNVINTPEILEALRASLIVASCTTVLSLFLGTTVVMASAWWKTAFLFAPFYTNIFLPEIILAIGLLSAYAFLHLPVGYSSLIAGHTLLGLGFVVPVVRARFIELDPILTEASLDLGATYSQTMRLIILPLLMPSLIAAGFLVFTLSLDDFLISFFCSGPHVQVLSVYVFSRVNIGVDPTINAISVIFVAVSSLVVLLLWQFKLIDQVVPRE